MTVRKRRVKKDCRKLREILKELEKRRLEKNTKKQKTKKLRKVFENKKKLEIQKKESNI